MSLLCSLTGQVCVHPVLNPANGRVYEQHMIKQHLLIHHTDPITNEPLTEEQLIVINPASLALPPYIPTATATSSPAATLHSLLSSFNREWDGLMLEQFSLKKEIYSLKQELAHALYQYDAACRVIARMMQERDEAKAALMAATAEQQNNNSTAATTTYKTAAVADNNKEQKQMEVDDQQDRSRITPAVTRIFEYVSDQLGGKKRKALIKELEKRTTDQQTIKEYTQTASYSLHGVAIPGITALDIQENTESTDNFGWLVSGGVDGSVIVFDADVGKIKQTLKAHKKKVTQVAFIQPPTVNDLPITDADSDIPHALNLTTPLPILSVSADHTTQLFTYNRDAEQYSTAYHLDDHEHIVTSLSIHPSSLFFVTASLDCSWILYDTETGQKRLVAHEDNPSATTAIKHGFTRIAFHPDGRIVGVTAQDGTVKIYDVLQGVNVATFRGHSLEADTQVTTYPESIAFGPNGYYCATGDNAGVVKVWDLKHVASDKPVNIQTLTPPVLSTTTESSSSSSSSSQQHAAAHIHSLQFDTSGTYLAVAGGHSVYMYETKTWSVVQKWDHKDEVYCVRIARDARWLASASKDRTIKLWSNKPAQTPAA